MIHVLLDAAQLYIPSKMSKLKYIKAWLSTELGRLMDIKTESMVMDQV